MAGVGVGTIDRNGLVNGVPYNGNLPQPGQPGYNGMQDGMAGGSGNWGQSLGGSDTRSAGNGATTGASTQPALSLGNLAPATTDASASNPTGLPTAAQVAQDAPLPLQSFGATPTVTPSYATAATVDPQYNQQYLQQQEAANYNALQPTFQAQDQTNQDQLAARGISSSGAAADLTNQLYGQQAATLASADSSAIGQQAGYVQSDIAANQNNLQQTNLFNAGEGTSASDVNAQYYDQAVTGNATTYNNYLNTIENQGYNTSNEAYTAYLNSFDPSSGVTSAYDNAVSGIGNAATGAYDSSVQGEGTALGGLFGGVGQVVAAGEG